MTTRLDMDRIASLLEQARGIAIEYHCLTGKPPGITGEAGEHEAGYGAVGPNGRRLRIKSRSIPRAKRLVGQRLGAIDLDKFCDAVL
ncbi:MAG: hypothetical protein ACREDM_09965 [Methylocella sp.]